jgi:hypothetical protein
MIGRFRWCCNALRKDRLAAADLKVCRRRFLSENLSGQADKNAARKGATPNGGLDSPIK